MKIKINKVGNVLLNKIYCINTLLANGLSISYVNLVRDINSEFQLRHGNSLLFVGNKIVATQNHHINTIINSKRLHEYMRIDLLHDNINIRYSLTQTTSSSSYTTVTFGV